MIWVLWVVALIVFGYLAFVKPFKYWTNRGIPQRNVYGPFGDNLGTVLHKQSFAEMVDSVYKACPNTRYSGMYLFYTPTLVLRDTELIKQIAVKDFDHFLDHRSLIPVDSDPLWGSNLLLLTGQRWRDMRSTLSPAFTSSKMKYMFTLISENAEQFAKHFLKQDKPLIEMEMKDTLTKFANDVIASTAFGVKCDSLGEPDNQFYKMGKQATTFTGIWNNFKFFGFLFCPHLFKRLGVKLFDQEVGNFFTTLVQDNIKNRETHNIIRPDMIQLLLEARKNGFKHDDSPIKVDDGFAAVNEHLDNTKNIGKKADITDVDITAQALIFFFAGFDSVSGLMSFLSYELGVNPDCQEKLRTEIDETYEKCNGKITYEALLKMKYLDMVISETLRKWPNSVGTDRVCTKPYTIEPVLPGEKPIHIKQNELVFIPIYGLQHDPEYFPEPEKFDPERFSDENKHKIRPYSYLPFGVGPRNCIGSRFALLETKALIFEIIRNFEIVPTEKTQIPLQLNRKSFSMTAENGFWFGLKRRVK